jgi:hypothetical protein
VEAKSMAKFTRQNNGSGLRHSPRTTIPGSCAIKVIHPRVFRDKPRQTATNRDTKMDICFPFLPLWHGLEPAPRRTLCQCDSGPVSFAQHLAARRRRTADFTDFTDFTDRNKDLSDRNHEDRRFRISGLRDEGMCRRELFSLIPKPKNLKPQAIPDLNLSEGRFGACNRKPGAGTYSALPFRKLIFRQTRFFATEGEQRTAVLHP